MGIDVKSKMSNEGMIFEKAVKSIVNTNAKVGWFGTYPPNEDGNIYPVGGIAYINEVGGVMPEGNKVPARPFLRPTIDSKQNKWMNNLKKGIKKVLAGDQKISDALFDTGKVVEKDIQNTISDLWSPKLHPFTISERLRKRGLTIGSSGQGLNRKQIKKIAFSGVLGASTSSRSAVSLIDKPLIDTGLFINSISTIVEKS